MMKRIIILKSEPKPDDRKTTTLMIIMREIRERDTAQIHDEQRSIQMTVSHRHTHENTAQTSTVIINNASKNSKCRPK